MEKVIETYKLCGSIAIWKYKEYNRNSLGWHISMDSVGRKSLIELIVLMLKSPWPSRKIVNLTDPFEMDICKVNYNSKKNDVAIPKTLFLDYKKEAGSLWNLQRINSQLILSVGTQKLLALQENLANNAFDSAMCDDEGNDSDLLNFW